ncbi:urease accessory protein UreE [Pontivivens insulae]|uniref:Urease accessory protein UreE n=1 Tax=Pontivivens insulae TaxID=1639689 RepID=A0A2R8AB13_9RHOB|nr:urease accessory protein UreE [Pontivivens insulae]RED13321.1 urease accessory protein [Pontivivens insulae]SPF29413.1 Urease accessory protein UreE 1 [Pontivivens insulae]
MTRATKLTHSHDAPADTITLAYDDRFRRRMAMTGDGGTAFLLDLPDAQELRAGDSLVLDDGRLIRIVAADEPLMEAVPEDLSNLARVAWHVGNRHLTCQILSDRLVLRADKVIAHMLEHLGCAVTYRDGPFTPEGGAYGQGRTHSHEH